MILVRHRISISECNMICRAGDYKYMGMRSEWSGDRMKKDGHECWCGNSFREESFVAQCDCRIVGSYKCVYSTAPIVDNIPVSSQKDDIIRLLDSALLIKKRLR
eukprot:UN15033